MNRWRLWWHTRAQPKPNYGSPSIAANGTTAHPNAVASAEGPPATAQSLGKLPPMGEVRLAGEPPLDCKTPRMHEAPELCNPTPSRELPPPSPLQQLSLKDLETADRFALEAVCRAQAQPLYLGDHSAICRMLTRYKLLLDTRDRGLAAHVLLDGYWEMWLTIFLCRRIKNGMVVADVGANFGYYTLLLADMVGEHGHVFAIEPNREVAALLRQSVVLNGFAQRTSVIEAAAGAEIGTGLLYAPHREFKNAHIIDSPQNVIPENGTLQQVQQIVIDDLLASRQSIDFMKIDAEGSEEAIVRGMQKCIAAYRPSIVLEFNAARGKEPKALLECLVSAYKRIHYIDFHSNLIPITETELMSSRIGEDWLLFFEREGA